MASIPPEEPVFQISVVARVMGMHQQTLRKYERDGFLRPHRTGGNTRLYSQRDIERLQQMVRLVDELGVNLAGAEVILRMTNQIEELRRELDETRAEVGRLRGALGVNRPQTD